MTCPPYTDATGPSYAPSSWTSHSSEWTTGSAATTSGAAKVDWTAAGLSTVRADTTERRALDAMQPASGTCVPDESVDDISAVVALHGSVLVLDVGVLLGRVRARHLIGVHPATPVEEIMEPGPATVRANEPLDALLERMTPNRSKN